MAFSFSVFSIAGAFTKIVDMVYSFFRYRTSKCRKLKEAIDRKEKQLAQALREGRVTDANYLAAERRELYEKYNGCTDGK